VFRQHGLAGVVIATETFKALVMAQDKPRKLDPRLIVVKHPVGGLNAEELKELSTAEGLKLEMKG
jgi:hypothetical protein